jgi:excisionase family DNA binding protein
LQTDHIIIQIVQEMILRELLSPKQVARAIGVSEASLKRWCDKGMLPSTRTAGGHRRLPISGVVQFLRQTGQPLVRPEVLGLPPSVGTGKETIERARAQLRPVLEAGDEQQAKRILLDLYLAGHSVGRIGDEVVTPAFHDIGQRWQHGDIEVYEERRGCEVCVRALYALRQVLPPIAEAAPLAIGATAEGDPYTIPTLMAELALREAGWHADSYGIGHPFITLASAIRKVRPRLFWLSASTIAEPEEFLRGYAQLFDAAMECGTAIIVGGRALTVEIRRGMQYAAFGDTMTHLATFARSLALRT